MSCNRGGNDVTNCLSPVQSPVPQVKQHTAVNLTGDARKVKDLAADFHNLMMKWNSLNSKGMEIVTKIGNVKIEKVFNVRDTEEGADVTTLPMELNPLCDLLTETVEAMSNIEAKMQYKVEMAVGLVSLQKFEKSKEANTVLFSTMTLDDIANTVKEIHQAFKKELGLKRELCKQVAHADDRDITMFYTTCWLHQPYIGPHCHDQLDALLKETGHLK